MSSLTSYSEPQAVLSQVVAEPAEIPAGRVTGLAVAVKEQEYRPMLQTASA